MTVRAARARAPLLGVVDYGMGNLHSVAKALEASGARVRVSRSRKTLSASDGLVLPGVGHFGAAMTALAKSRLDDFLRGWLERDLPYLGICLGYQLLFDDSEEDPRTPGLGALAGRVIRFRARKLRRQGLKIPHMGWNRVFGRGPGNPLRNLPDGSYFYFVHSYYPRPEQSLAGTRTEYGLPFVSSVARGSLFACQFHPEKSGANGLKLLREFSRGVRHGR